uniref:Uncharacterized protein n=1 Tax=Lotus japonicus TaxID=34305 RepID=I3SXJ3_LOTJA|nr:unknown [Lotus japonicus]
MFENLSTINSTPKINSRKKLINSRENFSVSSSWMSKLILKKNKLILTCCKFCNIGGCRH